MIAPQETGGIVPVRRNGCFNRPPYKSTLMVFDGYTTPARTTTKTKEIPFRMDQNCRYTHSSEGQKDTGCINCRHRVTL